VAKIMSRIVRTYASFCKFPIAGNLPKKRQNGIIERTLTQKELNMPKDETIKNRLLDPQIRDAIFDHLEGNSGKIRIIEEVNIGGSRADFLAVTDGVLTGYEIKSDADSYTRLDTQTRDYSAFCDYCYVVIGKSHQTGIYGHVPDFWGIIVIVQESDGVKLEQVRQAELSPNVAIRNKLWILWKRELVNIRVKFGLQKYESKDRNYLLRSLEKQVPKELLSRAVTDELFERDYTIK